MRTLCSSSFLSMPYETFLTFFAGGFVHSTLCIYYRPDFFFSRIRVLVVSSLSSCLQVLYLCMYLCFLRLTYPKSTL